MPMRQRQEIQKVLYAAQAVHDREVKRELETLSTDFLGAVDLEYPH
jgi:hypothetical protein